MKQRFKKHVALILIGLMLLSLIGCGKPASTDTTTTTEATVTEAPAASISDAATTADSTPADASEEALMRRRSIRSQSPTRPVVKLRLKKNRNQS